MDGTAAHSTNKLVGTGGNTLHASTNRWPDGGCWMGPLCSQITAGHWALQTGLLQWDHI
jgi:hypothetical protein